MNKDEIIKFLSHDRAFGILTRNALELKLKSLEKPFRAIFFDFVDLHNLNKNNGYKKVNEDIRKAFKEFEFRETDIVGRWFSGDEILVAVTDNGSDIIKLTDRLCIHFDKYNLKIRTIILAYKIIPSKFLNQINREINLISGFSR